ncbi:hypothetical protein MCAMS1_02198 [biofilm metagenome]
MGIDHHENSSVKAKDINQDPSPQRTVNFGPYVFDRANAILRRNGKAIPMTPKAFAVLGHLIDFSGELVTKEALFDTVWPNVVVTEAALTVCIREIRKALGDEPSQPVYIETVHKHGFRFIGKINKISELIAAHRLVGRDAALAALQSALAAALAETRQLIFITGEAGIGKTSVLETFVEQLSQTGDYWIAKGQCIEHYGAGEAYLPLLDALGRLCRQADEEALPALLVRYAPSWLSLLPSVRFSLGAAEKTDSMAKTSPERRMREIAEALEAISQNRPLIFCLEDLHWCDQSTTEMLSFLARRRDPARLLILATLRPADTIVNNLPLRDVKQDLQLHGLCTHLPLEFLSTTDIAGYLAANFSPNWFPEDLAAFIHQQTDGNPLFIVNVLADLRASGLLTQESGCWQLQASPKTLKKCVPENLQAMINQQVDRLEPGDQALLEAAGITGEPGGVAVQFTVTETAAALAVETADIEGRLEKLARTGHFLRSLGITEWPDGSLAGLYEFTHALYQNVIYARTPVTQKIVQHRRLGSRLEQGYGPHCGEIANKLAVHFEYGREFLKACHYLCLSANEASRRGASREAILSLRKAQQLLDKVAGTPERDRQELCVLQLLAPAMTAGLGNAVPEIETVYLRAFKLSEELGDNREKFPVLFGLRSFYMVTGELAKSHELAESLLRLAEEINDSGLILEAHVGLASSYFYLGNLKASYDHAIEGINRYDARLHNDHAAKYGLDPGVFCYARAGQTAWALGFPDRALDYAVKGVALAETLEHPYSEVFAIHHLTMVYLSRRDGKAALESAYRGNQLATQHDFAFLSAWSYFLRAWAFSMLQDAENARLDIQRALAAPHPESCTTASFLGLFLAECYWHLQGAEEGLAILAKPARGHQYDVERLRLQAEFYLLSLENSISIDQETEYTRQAEALFRNALTQSDQQGTKSYSLRIALGLSRLLSKLNRDKEAYALLNNVYLSFNEGFNTVDSQEAVKFLNRLTE